jgi:hypothetical protein
MSRICFLHAGTHKSGSTYLQNFLQCNEYALASEGLYVPVTGRVRPSGHHNIAWEFTGDARYKPNQGNLSALVAELSAVQVPRACVSSEDFEYLFQNPAALKILRSGFNEIDCAVKVLFFLRPQADYAESLYAESVRHGLDLDFPEFLELIASGNLEQGPILDYSVLLKPFADVFGVDNVIVRPFRNSTRPDQILTDFLSQMLTKFDLGSGQYRVNCFKENASIPFSQVFQHFVANNVKRPSLRVQIDTVALARSVQPHAKGDQYLSGPFDPVNFQDVVTKFWKLAVSNLKVLCRYHVLIPFVSGNAFRRDIGALFGFNVNGRMRRSLINMFRRTSRELKEAVNGVEPLGEASEKPSDAESVASRPTYMEKGPASDSDHLVSRLRLELTARDECVRRLRGELIHRELELRQARMQAATEIDRRESEIELVKTQLITLRNALAAPPFSMVRVWLFAKRFAVLCKNASTACCAAAHRFASTLRTYKFARVIAQSGLFDAPFYLMQRPELKTAGIDPLAHFLEHGSAEGTNPHHLFDCSYYMEQNRDVARIAVNPLIHFVTHGAREGRDPHPLFDTSYYMEQNPDVARAGDNALLHFISGGAYEGRDPSPLFDVSYYLEQYPDVAKKGVNPLIHFIQVGASEGRNPHPLFDTSYYLQANPEVARARLNPLVHFIRYGALEGRNPNPLFDVSFYRGHNAEVEGGAFNQVIQYLATVNPLVHFVQYGVHEARDPHPLFDTSYYLEKNPDVARTGMNPLVHFLKKGGIEGRKPCEQFDVLQYVKENPEVQNAGINPVVHFILRTRKA